MAGMTSTAQVRVRYPRSRGSIVLRGDTPPLSWETSLTPKRVDGDTSVFIFPVETGSAVELKAMRDDGAWARGRNAVVVTGDDLLVTPTFDRSAGTLTAWMRCPTRDAPLDVRVYLPASYDEQVLLRYPVVYAQDGQSLWSDEHDPLGVWQLDGVIDELVELGALQELIVVSIKNGARRLQSLSPVPDPLHGGGGGPGHLEAIVDQLKPWIDSTYRTQPEREQTALLGSSMGGLFSLFAAWTRPDVFGKVMCLSSSFWWADRWIVKRVSDPVCPAPRPSIYLDSGVALNTFEGDPSVRDGFHHTQAVARALLAHCFERGHDLHVLSFAGLRHDAGSWSARVAIPLQLMFPQRD
jgi:predicted alpha/beta superfamily hydrolase